MNGKQLVAILGAVGMVAGSFMDWLTASAGFVSVSAKGIDGDGKITVVLGLLVLVLLMSKGNAKGAAVLSGIAAAVTVYEVYHANQKMHEVAGDGVRASVGTGLWVLLVGSVLAMVAAWSWHSEGKVGVPTDPGEALRNLPPPSLP